MTASAALLAELRLSPQPVEMQALLAALAIEGGPSGFLSLYGDSAAHPNAWAGPLDAFPDWPGVETRQGWTHAAGQWQDQPGTYRGAVGRTGRAGFHPQDQIANNADIATHDFTARSGLDLLQTLQAGRLPIVHCYLAATWPLGANAGLAKRYADNLAVLQLPPPAPPPPPPAEKVLDTITDAAGRKIEIVERITAVGIVMMMLGAAGGFAAGRNMVAPIPAVSAAPIAVPAASNESGKINAPLVAPDYAGPSWRFGQTASGHLAVECRQSDGSWPLCPK